MGIVTEFWFPHDRLFMETFSRILSYVSKKNCPFLWVGNISEISKWDLEDENLDKYIIKCENTLFPLFSTVCRIGNN